MSPRQAKFIHENRLHVQQALAELAITLTYHQCACNFEPEKPVVEKGFYYYFVRADAFTTDDLSAIESEMRSIVKQNEKITRVIMTRAEAIKYFQDKGKNYKVEIIKDIPDHEELSVYFQGDFADLCRGPHCPSTVKVKTFKLMKVAGAYWRGDSRKQMLQRIYGIL